MESGDPPEHFLAEAVQFLQLVFNEHSIKRLALLNKLLPKNYELIYLVGVECNFLLETLFTV